MVSSGVKQQCFSRSENRENNKLMDGDGWRELWRKILKLMDGWLEGTLEKNSQAYGWMVVGGNFGEKFSLRICPCYGIANERHCFTNRKGAECAEEPWMGASCVNARQ